MAKTLKLPTFPRIKHLCPKSLRVQHILDRITKDPRAVYGPNSIDSDWQYLAYTPEEAFLCVLDLLAVPVHDKKLSKARKRASAAIRTYLDGLLKQ